MACGAVHGCATSRLSAPLSTFLHENADGKVGASRPLAVLTLEGEQPRSPAAVATRARSAITTSPGAPVMSHHLPPDGGVRVEQLGDNAPFYGDTLLSRGICGRHLRSAQKYRAAIGMAPSKVWCSACQRSFSSVPWQIPTNVLDPSATSKRHGLKTWGTISVPMRNSTGPTNTSSLRRPAAQRLRRKSHIPASRLGRPRPMATR